MGTSTIYTAHGSTTDTDTGTGAIFVQVPVSGDNGTDNDGSVYDVVIDPIEGQHQCSCMSFAKSGECRHVSACLALNAHGKL